MMSCGVETYYYYYYSLYRNWFAAKTVNYGINYCTRTSRYDNNIMYVLYYIGH